GRRAVQVEGRDRALEARAAHDVWGVLARAQVPRRGVSRRIRERPPLERRAGGDEAPVAGVRLGDVLLPEPRHSPMDALHPEGPVDAPGAHLLDRDRAADPARDLGCSSQGSGGSWIAGSWTPRWSSYE